MDTKMMDTEMDTPPPKGFKQEPCSSGVFCLSYIVGLFFVIFSMKHLWLITIEKQ